MDRRAWVVVAAALALIVGLATVLVARQHHTAPGTPATARTPADLSAEVRKDCPSGPPEGCQKMIAGLLHVDVETLPTIPVSVEGLSLRQEYVSGDNAATMDVGFEYDSSSGQGPTLRLTYGEFEPGELFRERYVPDDWVFDTRPIVTTPHGRPIRISRTWSRRGDGPRQYSTLDARFQDEHFGYVVTPGKPGTLTPDELALAEQLIDAIRLHSHQTNPLVVNAPMSCKANTAFYDEQYRLLDAMRAGAETDMRKAIDNGTREAELQILSEVQQAMRRLVKQRPSACP